jgi:hypothetical protein
MRRHAPTARAVGAARLGDHCFVITADGYASVAPAPAQAVHGVLWRLTPRDRVTLDAWENVAAGLYRCETVLVQVYGRRMPALVYIARPKGGGRVKPGYMELVIAAAREWDLPSPYIKRLERLLPPQRLESSAPFKGPARKLGEFG